ncbi:hypothetical protein Hanom_Chr17g01535161 [Helianthus anomalus]
MKLSAFITLPKFQRRYKQQIKMVQDWNYTSLRKKQYRRQKEKNYPFCFTSKNINLETFYAPFRSFGSCQGYCIQTETWYVTYLKHMTQSNLTNI